MIYSVTLNPSIDYIVKLDNFTEGELNRSKGEYTNAGGKGIMVSKLLSNLGIDNIALGFLGGYTGQYIKDWFNQEGLREDFTRVNENTRINVKLKSMSDSGQIIESEINGRGPKISASGQDDFLNKIRKLNPDDTLIISGSSSPGLDKDIVDQMINICKDRGSDFVVDTTGGALMEAMRQRPLLVKPNTVELAQLFSVELETKDDIVKYGKKCLEIGAQYAIVSMGGDGAMFFDKDKVYYSPVVKGQLVNSVGAGDSMIAGFVGAIKSGRSPIDSFRYSVATGTATAFCEDIGKKEEVDNILSRVVVEEYI